MSTPATLTFSEIPLNQRVLFVNAQAWNNWFAGITISISDTNLPLATASTVGAVKQASLTYSYTLPGFVPEYIDWTDLNGNVVKVPSRADFDALSLQIQSTYALVTNLITALQNAGIITTTV